MWQWSAHLDRHGVNAEGYREILGIQVTSAEDGAGWLAFFRDLVARGPCGRSRRVDADLM